MRREITQRELRNESGAIMRALDKGDSFVITRNGVAVGELSPIGRREFVRSDVLQEAFMNAPAVSYERLRKDLDAYIDQDPGPRG